MTGIVERDARAETTLSSLRPPRFDVILAVIVAVFIFVVYAIDPSPDSTADPSPWSFVLGPLAALLLMFRRVRPVATLLVIVAVVVVHLLIVRDGGPIGIPILIGLYTVGAEGNRRRSLVVAAGTAILVSAAAFLVAPESPTFLEQMAAVGLSILPIVVGDAVRSRRALVAEANERVRMAEVASARDAEQRVQDERVRIARELHDVVAHSIATINVQAGVAAHVIEDGPAKDALVEIKEASKLAMGEMRAMLGVLRSTDEDDGPLLPSPDIHDVDDLIERFAGAASFEVTGAASQVVDPAVGLVVYRVVQEGLTNSLKHALDAFVDVTINYRDEEIDVKVADDGGTSHVDNADGSGLGIVGLEERVRSVGGTFRAGPRFSGGFEIEATVPYVVRTSS